MVIAMAMISGGTSGACFGLGGASKIQEFLYGVWSLEVLYRSEIPWFKPLM